MTEELNVGSGKKCSSCGGTVAADRKTCQNCGHSFASLGERVEAAEGAVIALANLELGDTAGHDFHGNQYSGGSGSSDRTNEGQRLKSGTAQGGQREANRAEIGTPLAGVSEEGHAAGIAAVHEAVAKDPDLQAAADQLHSIAQMDGGETSIQMERNQIEEELSEVVGDNERGVNYTDEDVADMETAANRRAAVLDIYESAVKRAGG